MENKWGGRIFVSYVMKASSNGPGGNLMTWTNAFKWLPQTI